MRKNDARRSYLLGAACLAILAPLFLLAHISAEERLSQPAGAAGLWPEEQLPADKYTK